MLDSILLVEDERDLGQSLEIGLKPQAKKIVWVTTLAQAHDAIAQLKPQLILLDVMLPDGDGMQFCEKIRGEGYAGAVLMLTAKGATLDKVQGLKAGADDYLSKPFDHLELEARIQSLARAMKRKMPQALSSSGAWHLDSDRLEVTYPAGKVQLTPLEFKLVKCLVESQGKIVSRETLLKEVWGFSLLPKTRTVDQFLAKIRKQFGDPPDKPKHFLTIRGAGYRFEP